MNKTTKGALAAAAAATVLLGGGGSLAYWTATSHVDAGTITSGNMSLSTATCPASWTYATGAAEAGQPVVKFVPGDKITKACTFTVTANGDNLAATLATPATLTYSSAPAAPSLVLTNTATYAISGGTNPRSIANGGTVTSADNGATVTATFNVTIPYGTDESGTPKVNANDTQDITATLNAIDVTLTQTNPN